MLEDLGIFCLAAITAFAVLGALAPLDVSDEARNARLGFASIAGILIGLCAVVAA